MKNLIVFLILSVISVFSINAQNFDLLKNRAKKATQERFEKSWLNVEVLKDVIVDDVQQDKNAGIAIVVTEISFVNTTPWVIYSYGKKGFVIDGKLPEFPYCNYYLIEEGTEFSLKTHVTFNEAMGWEATEIKGYWDTAEQGTKISAKQAKEITSPDIHVDESEIWNEPDTMTHFMLRGVWKNENTGEELVVSRDKFLYTYAAGNLQVLGSDIRVIDYSSYTLNGKNKDGRTKQIQVHGIIFAKDRRSFAFGDEIFVKQ